ncbi:hypothetical protein PG993_014767 [Apiospora rasikravindrae]|uniref:Ubiquitin 3 binding protein But2 C-terminal domain-containing protein n=1 Tax=Apiospora rasikravindrae TaxID=990691 RepID=A0ABR1RQU9_9PEZI
MIRLLLLSSSVLSLSILPSFTSATYTVQPYPTHQVRRRPLLDHEWAPLPRDSGAGCPAYLTPGEYEFPHYITQISATQPDRAFGPSLHGKFTPNDVSSLFSFDIPADRANANCSLVFLFPRKEQLKTSSYVYNGPGTFVFTGYDPGYCPDGSTTFNKQPPSTMFPPFAPLHMEPGFAYTIDVGPCSFSAGKCVSGKTSTPDTYFEFFQNSDECPIGVFTTYSYGLPCKPPYC